jgi:hypothetical protein
MSFQLKIARLIGFKRTVGTKGRKAYVRKLGQRAYIEKVSVPCAGATTGQRLQSLPLVPRLGTVAFV